MHWQFKNFVRLCAVFILSPDKLCDQVSWEVPCWCCPVFSDVLLVLTDCVDAQSTARADATCICFKLLDIDHDGYLNWKELYVFAMNADFKGGPVMEMKASVWAMEYKSICENYGADVDRGLELGQFGAMVDDESPTGCHCFTQELEQIILKLRGWQPRRAADGDHAGCRASDGDHFGHGSCA